tara:strand:- start:198 stop:1373 length:1176 start_codon:yes stop_codon:yes gene_type:complete
MNTFKTYNNISKEGISILKKADFKINNLNPDSILLRSHKLTLTELKKAKLKCVGRAGTGVNNIPLEPASKNGIVVFNTPGANSNAVKELVICGMLLSSRGIIEGNLFARSLKNESIEMMSEAMESNKSLFKGNELKDKTLGIIGLGAIGSLVAEAANILGMKIIGYDPYISIESAWRIPNDVEKADSLNYLLKNSDYITVHVPLTPDTKNLISKKNIDLIKKDSKIINLSRGDIVNNEDILMALKLKKISKYVTDFPSPNLAKRSHKNNDVILLPHIGASTKEAEINCSKMAASQIIDFLSNGNITNSVNFPTIKMSRSSKYRLVIIYEDAPGIIGNVAGKIATYKTNIADMVNKNRDSLAISLIDIDRKPSNTLVTDLSKIDKVISVRFC